MIKHIKLESFRGLHEKKDLDLSAQTIPYVLIFGDGGTGKSSFIGFIRAMLTGVVSDDDINQLEGKATGEIEFEKGGKRWKVQLRKTTKSETMTVFLYSDELKLWTKAGGKELLRELVGHVWIDPIELQRMPIKKQAEWYRSVTGVNTDELDGQIKSLMEDRLIAGRMRDDLKGFVMASTDTFDMEASARLYAEERPLQPLLDRKDDLIKVESKRKSFKTAIETEKSRISDAEARIKRLKDEILKEEVIISAAKDRAHAINKDILALPEGAEAEIAAVEAEIASNAAYNQHRSEFMKVREKFASFEEKEREYNTLTEKIEATRKQKADYIAASGLSIEGLELTDDGLQYNNLPVSALSTTEIVTLTKLVQEKVNPTGLPVMIIDDGESMGSKFMTELERLVSDNPDLKVFLSIMDRSESVIRIEMREKI